MATFELSYLCWLAIYRARMLYPTKDTFAHSNGRPCSSSSSAQVPCRVQWRFHLNEGESSCRRRLCQPPSSARQPQLFLRLPPLPTSGQCSSVSRPALLPCTMRAHGGGYSLCPPPGSVCQEGGPAVFAILLSSSSARTSAVPCTKEDLPSFFYRPAVIVSLSSSSETVPHRAQ